MAPNVLIVLTANLVVKLAYMPRCSSLRIHPVSFFSLWVSNRFEAARVGPTQNL